LASALRICRTCVRKSSATADLPAGDFAGGFAADFTGTSFRGLPGRLPTRAILEAGDCWGAACAAARDLILIDLAMAICPQQRSRVRFTKGDGRRFALGMADAARAF
jgi:hypothetical protein